MRKILPEKLLTTAVSAAHSAGAIQRTGLEKGIDIRQKGESQNLVTNIDIDCEKAVVDIIRSTYPEHNIIGEEGKYQLTDSEFTWIIDPLDGTNNYAKGIPQFAASVAVAKDGEILAAAVFDPMKDELFTASQGGGAYLNGKAISVSVTENPEDSLVITGFYYDRGEGMKRNLAVIEKVFQAGIIGLRRFGAATLDLCYVACGRAEGFWEHHLAVWDYAAAMLILKEAGGVITDYSGNDPGLTGGCIVSGNRKIHSHLQSLIQS
ncbi:MAG: inositol monophosphatase family protein [Spirochaetia bacterium]